MSASARRRSSPSSRSSPARKPSPAPRRLRTLQLSRHLASDDQAYIICSKPASWRSSAATCMLAALLHLTHNFQATVIGLLFLALRLGPLNEILRWLPPVLSKTDFKNRRFRVRQSLWLVSICCSIYTLLPDEKVTGPMQGWKLNLVTMETSIASGIAATYGYSVAGGVPGGLLAEHVMQWLGKGVVAEMSPLLGPTIAKSATGFCLFFLMGSIMHVGAICAYAFAHEHVLEAETREKAR